MPTRGNNFLGEGEPLCWRERGSPSPKPPSLPQRALFKPPPPIRQNSRHTAIIYGTFQSENTLSERPGNTGRFFLCRAFYLKKINHEATAQRRPALSCCRIFYCPIARQSSPLRPRYRCSVSRARRRSRTPKGRTERRSRRGHRPAHRAGKVRADAPRDTRRTGDGSIRETTFALP